MLLEAKHLCGPHVAPSHPSQAFLLDFFDVSDMEV